MRYKDITIYEDFIARMYNPTTSNFKDSANSVSHLAAALIDTNTKYSSKGKEFFFLLNFSVPFVNPIF